MLSRPSSHVVVVRVLADPPIHKGPRDPVHSILLVLNSPRNNICIQVIMQLVIEGRLDGIGLLKELDKVLFPWSVAKDYTLG